MFSVAGKYHVIAPLGGGGMGAVYEAVHSGTGRRVAVKMIRQEIAASDRQRERFVREARLAGSLASPYVAQILDAGTDDVSGLPFIVMELLEGPNLRDLLRERGRLPVGVVLAIAAQIATGLEEAHEAGVIHRDIKPANIVLCTSKSGELVAKVIDFGVAKAVEDAERGLTRTGDIVGSLRYMSPEQLNGEPATVASDLWSLGAVMYEAVSGVGTAGNADALAAIVSKVCLAPIEPLATLAPWVPRDVAELVHRALARDPRARFSSARDMQQAIGQLLPHGMHVQAATLTSDRADAVPIVTGHTRARAEGSSRGRRWPWVVGIGLALSGVTALVATAPLRDGGTSSKSLDHAPSLHDPTAEDPPIPTATVAAPQLAAPSLAPTTPEPSPPPSAKASLRGAASIDSPKGSKSPARPSAGHTPGTKAADPLDHM